MRINHLLACASITCWHAHQSPGVMCGARVMRINHLLSVPPACHQQPRACHQHLPACNQQPPPPGASVGGPWCTEQRVCLLLLSQSGGVPAAALPISGCACCRSPKQRVCLLPRSQAAGVPGLVPIWHTGPAPVFPWATVLILPRACTSMVIFSVRRVRRLASNPGLCTCAAHEHGLRLCALLPCRSNRGQNALPADQQLHHRVRPTDDHVHTGGGDEEIHARQRVG